MYEGNFKKAPIQSKANGYSFFVCKFKLFFAKAEQFCTNRQEMKWPHFSKMSSNNTCNAKK